jgi:hypothetical protein
MDSMKRYKSEEVAQAHKAQHRQQEYSDAELRGYAPCLATDSQLMSWFRLMLFVLKTLARLSYIRP